MCGSLSDVHSFLYVVCTTEQPQICDVLSAKKMISHEQQHRPDKNSEERAGNRSSFYMVWSILVAPRSMLYANFQNSDSAVTRPLKMFLPEVKKVRIAKKANSFATRSH